MSVQVFDVYAEFEEQLITLKIDQRTKQGKNPDNELDLQLRLRRFERFEGRLDKIYKFRALYI